MNETPHQAAPRRGKPKQNQTFLFSAREEMLIVAAEWIAFFFLFISLLGLKTGPTFKAGEGVLPVRVTSCFLSYGMKEHVSVALKNVYVSHTGKNSHPD